MVLCYGRLIFAGGRRRILKCELCELFLEQTREGAHGRLPERTHAHTYEYTLKNTYNHKNVVPPMISLFCAGLLRTTEHLSLSLERVLHSQCKDPTNLSIAGPAVMLGVPTLPLAKVLGQRSNLQRSKRS